MRDSRSCSSHRTIAWYSSATRTITNGSSQLRLALIVGSVAVLYAGKFLVAVFINRALMVSGLRLGFFCNIRATVPETTGVAMLVPLSRKYLAVPELVEPV